ncbi:hypothetical protein, partial [Streptomyces sp. IB2014 016-6]|uniref:hypothetical protein n=1 Tax=Streptomyces sp. IB2014 016-6 TaxID=2517818 RepID=UPI0011C731F3
MPPEGNQTDQAAHEERRRDKQEQKNDWVRKLREDPEYRKQEVAARTNRRRRQRERVGSLAPSVAAEMYADYQRLHPDWPEVPPKGLKFAVDPESAELKSTKAALVVSFETQQTGQSASASSVPPFLADPYLDLDNSTVRNTVLRHRVGKPAYELAREWQTYFQDHTLLEEFEADAALIQEPGQFHHPAQDHDYPAPGQEPAEMFSDVN